MSKPQRKSVEVECSRCSGTGFVPLSFVYSETLEVIRRYGKKGAGVGLLAKVCDSGYTTMCNRVTKLESLGLVTINRFDAKTMIVVIKE